MRSLGLVDLGAANPRRPIDWRWQRAGRMLELGLRWSRRRDDEATRMAKQYQASLRRCRGEADRRRLACRMPDIGGAFAIFEGEPTARMAVEARLLAGEPIEAIARHCGVPVEVAELYEQLFFNVVDRLTSTSYILSHAIGPATYENFDGDDTEAVLKWFAYMGGPLVLDFLLGGGDTPCDLLPTEGHAIPPEEATRSARLRRMALVAKALPINQSTAMRLIRLYAFQQELVGTSSSGAREVASASLDSMFGALTQTLGDEVHGSVGTDGSDLDDASKLTPDPVITEEPVGIDLLKFAEVVAAKFAEGVPETRTSGARRGA
jgi:hypothetical protein